MIQASYLSVTTTWLSLFSNAKRCLRWIMPPEKNTTPARENLTGVDSISECELLKLLYADFRSS
jgi:hypothetical protein